PASAPSFSDAPVPSALLASRPELELVESVPVETSLDHADVPDADRVWLEMIGSARARLDVAEVYVRLAPKGGPQPDGRLGPVVRAIELAADRGVEVRLLVDELFYAKYPETVDRLGRRKHVTARRIDMKPLTGGVMHAKYFVVDGR